MALPEKTTINHLIENLKKIFEKHHLAGTFTAQPRTNNGIPCDYVFKSLSGITLFIEMKSAISSKVVEHYSTLSDNLADENEQFLLAADQIPQTLIDRYPDSRLNFYSPEGASKIEIPSFCYIVKIVNRKKQPAGNSGTVFVGKASSLPRLFFDAPHRKWSQGELSDAADMTRGYVSICLKKMFQEGYITINDGKYELIAPDKMLNDWVAVYRFSRYIKRQMFAMHFANYDDGIEKLSKVLTKREIKFAFMGTSGAYLREPYMEQTTIMAYVRDMPYGGVDLFPVESGGNVILYIPQSEYFFIGEQNIKGYPVVSDIQLYLDLKKMPGRNEDQAEYLRQNKLIWE